VIIDSMESTNPDGSAVMTSMAQSLEGQAADLSEQSQPLRSQSTRRASLTMLGVALVALQCAGLVFVLAALAWLPESGQGIRMRTPAGLAVSAFALSGGLSCIALVLKAMGFQIVRRAA
jgi:hypothetical protein